MATNEDILSFVDTATGNKTEPTEEEKKKRQQELLDRNKDIFSFVNSSTREELLKRNNDIFDFVKQNTPESIPVKEHKPIGESVIEDHGILSKYFVENAKIMPLAMAEMVDRGLGGLTDLSKGLEDWYKEKGVEMPDERVLRAAYGTAGVAATLGQFYAFAGLGSGALKLAAKGASRMLPVVQREQLIASMGKTIFSKAPETAGVFEKAMKYIFVPKGLTVGEAVSAVSKEVVVPTMAGAAMGALDKDRTAMSEALTFGVLGGAFLFGKNPLFAGLKTIGKGVVAGTKATGKGIGAAFEKLAELRHGDTANLKRMDEIFESMKGDWAARKKLLLSDKQMDTVLKETLEESIATKNFDDANVIERIFQKGHEIVFKQPATKEELAATVKKYYDRDGITFFQKRDNLRVGLEEDPFLGLLPRAQQAAARKEIETARSAIIENNLPKIVKDQIELDRVYQSIPAVEKTKIQDGLLRFIEDTASKMEVPWVKQREYFQLRVLQSEAVTSSIPTGFRKLAPVKGFVRSKAAKTLGNYSQMLRAAKDNLGMPVEEAVKLANQIEEMPDAKRVLFPEVIGFDFYKTMLKSSNRVWEAAVRAYEKGMDSFVGLKNPAEIAQAKILKKGLGETSLKTLKLGKEAKAKIYHEGKVVGSFEQITEDAAKTHFTRTWSKKTIHNILKDTKGIDNMANDLVASGQYADFASAKNTVVNWLAKRSTDKKSIKLFQSTMVRDGKTKEYATLLLDKNKAELIKGIGLKGRESAEGLEAAIEKYLSYDSLETFSRSHTSKLAGFERLRKVDMPGYDISKGTYLKNVMTAIDRNVESKLFGQNYEEFYKLKDAIFTKAMPGQIEGVMSDVVDYVTGFSRPEKFKGTINLLKAWASATLISPLSTILNLGLGQANIFAKYGTVIGTKSFAKTFLANTGLSEPLERSLYESGALSGKIIEGQLKKSGILTEGLGGMAAQLNYKLSGMRLAETINRGAAGFAGEEFLIAHAKNAASNLNKSLELKGAEALKARKQAARSLRVMEELGVDMETFVRSGGKLSKPDIAVAKVQAEKTTQFFYDITKQHPLIHKHSLLGQLVSTAYQQTQFVTTHVLLEAAKGNLLPLAVYAPMAAGTVYARRSIKNAWEGKGMEVNEDDFMRDALSAVVGYAFDVAQAAAGRFGGVERSFVPAAAKPVAETVSGFHSAFKGEFEDAAYHFTKAFPLSIVSQLSNYNKANRKKKKKLSSKEISRVR